MIQTFDGIPIIASAEQQVLGTRRKVDSIKNVSCPMSSGG